MSAAHASLHESVLDRLGAAVITGAIAEGSVLRIEQVEDDFGVSRTVIREAVRVLEAMRVVSVRRRVGITVRPAAEWNAFDPCIIRWRLAGPRRREHLRALGELRRGVEPIAAGLAAQHATGEQCGVLTGAVIGMSVTARSGDLEAYLAHDVTFHRTLLAASANEMFVGLGDVVAEVLAGRTHHNLMPASPKPMAISLHATVAETVQSGDRAGAEQAMRDIIRETLDAVAEPESPPGD